MANRLVTESFLVTAVSPKFVTDPHTLSMSKGFSCAVFMILTVSLLCADQDLDSLAVSLKDLSEQVPAHSLGVTIIVAPGDPVVGNMLAQGADIVVDAANGDLNPGVGVSGALYAAAGSPSVDGVWRRDKQPINPGKPKRLLDGQAWFNTNPAVIAHYQDNIMHIIHAVAPVCAGTPDQGRALLKLAYKNSLAAMDWWLRQPDCLKNWNLIREQAGVAPRGSDHKPSIAFPLLGSGVFGCDPKTVAECAKQAIQDYFSETTNSRIGVIIIAPFTQEREEIVKQVFGGVK